MFFQILALAFFKLVPASETTITQPIWWGMPIILLSLTLVFGWLTVEITADTVRLRFGIGLIRRAWPLADIAGVRPVRNALWTGWGIRSGWDYALYNVSGRDAVELTFRDGRSRVRIGTDQPAALVAALAAARSTQLG